jgi:hypothetical protein
MSLSCNNNNAKNHNKKDWNAVVSPMDVGKDGSAAYARILENNSDTFIFEIYLIDPETGREVVEFISPNLRSNEKGDKGDPGEKGDRGPEGPRGPEGQKGEKGLTGDTGPEGPRGDRGYTGDPGIPGNHGPDGPPGQTGATPNLRVGDVISLPEFANAWVTITGTKENPYVSFGIPQGVTGETGPRGKGLEIKYNWASQSEQDATTDMEENDLGLRTDTTHMYIYTSLGWVDLGPVEMGPPGEDGESPRLHVDGTYTTEPGTNATVNIDNTDPLNPGLTFNIPRGNEGPVGITPQIDIGEVWTGTPGGRAYASMHGPVDHRYLDLEIPQGPVGPKGDNGDAKDIIIQDTATLPYDLAAYVTELQTDTEARLSFGIPQGRPGRPGERGIDGPKGDTGDAGAIRAVHSSTGLPGSQASVYNSGTMQNAELWFQIPAGVPGEPGEGVVIDGVSAQSIPYDLEAWARNGTSEPGHLILEMGIPVGHPGTPGKPGKDGEPGVGIPEGGTVGQILVKNSENDYDTVWIDNTGGGGGGGGGAVDSVNNLDPSIQVYPTIGNVRIGTRVSPDSKNLLRITNDGLFVDNPLPANVIQNVVPQNASMQAETLGHQAFVGVNVSPQDTNALYLADDGLYVPVQSASGVLTVTGTDTNSTGITISPTTGNPVVSVNVKMSADPANALTIKDDGLFVPSSETTGIQTISTLETNSTTMELVRVADNVQISTSVRLKSDPTNMLKADADGMWVDPMDAAVTSVTAANTGVIITPEEGLKDVTVGVRKSAQENNALQILTDGLFVPVQSGGGGGGAVDSVAALDGSVTVNPTIGNVFITANKSADAGNMIEKRSDGFYMANPVPEDVVENITAGDGTMTVATTGHNVTVRAKLDTASDNSLIVGPSGGLYVRASQSGAAVSSVAVTDSNSLDLSVSPATGDVNITGGVKVSTDANNALSIRGNGLYVPTSDTSGITSITVMPSPSIDMTAQTNGGAVTLASAVNVSATTGNLLTTQVDGLFVAKPTSDVTSVTAFDGSIVTSPVNGTGAVQVRAQRSNQAGNQLQIVADGLFVPESAAVTGVSSVSAGDATLTISPTVGDVKAIVRIDPDSTNALDLRANGLYVAPPEIEPTDVPVKGITNADQSVTVTSNANDIFSIGAKLSTSANNALTVAADGLYVPAAEASGVQSISGQLPITVTGNADTPQIGLAIDPNQSNMISVSSSGLLVAAIGKTNKAITTGVSAISNIATIEATLLVSPDAGNGLVVRDNGVYVPDSSTSSTVFEPTQFSGDGTGASPITLRNIADSANTITVGGDGVTSAVLRTAAAGLHILPTGTNFVTNNTITKTANGGGDSGTLPTAVVTSGATANDIVVAARVTDGLVDSTKTIHTLPVANGGTGVTDAAGIRGILGVGRTNVWSIANSSTHTTSSTNWEQITGGTYSVSNAYGAAIITIAATTNSWHITNNISGTVTVAISGSAGIHCNETTGLAGMRTCLSRNTTLGTAVGTIVGIEGMTHLVDGKCAASTPVVGVFNIPSGGEVYLQRWARNVQNASQVVLDSLPFHAVITAYEHF